MTRQLSCSKVMGVLLSWLSGRQAMRATNQSRHVDALTTSPPAGIWRLFSVLQVGSGLCPSHPGLFTYLTHTCQDDSFVQLSSFFPHAFAFIEQGIASGGLGSMTAIVVI
jgi:hypothetical protein